MSEDRIKEAFDAMTPSDDAKDRMFANILEALEDSEELVQDEPTAPSVVSLPVKKNKGLGRYLSAAACFLVLVLAGVTLAPRIISNKSTESDMSTTENAVSDSYAEPDADYDAAEVPSAVSYESGSSSDKSAGSAPSYRVRRFAAASEVDWDLVPRADIESMGEAQLALAEDKGMICHITCLNGLAESAGICLYQENASDLVILVGSDGTVRTWLDDAETDNPGFSVEVGNDTYQITLPRGVLSEFGFDTTSGAQLSGDFFLDSKGTRWWSGSGCYGKACYGDLII